MTDQIDTALVQQYKSGVQHLAQQKKSRLRGAVRVEPIGAERASFDQISATSATDDDERHGDTPLVEVPHSRRWVTPTPAIWATLVDRADQLRTINEWTSPYQQNGSMAIGRKIDDRIIAAAFASAVTGKTGTGSAAFDTANYQIAASGAGLTLGKLLTTKEILDAAENDDPEDPNSPGRFIACQAKQITNLLNTTEVKSADYNTVKALAMGQINTFLGFKFIRTQRLLTSSGSRRVMAWCKNSLLVGINSEFKVDIGPRKDKKLATQVYVETDVGATRMDETGVVDILCAE